VSFAVPEGGLCGLIGPNGAGKTTVFNLITGIYEPTRGDVQVDGKSIVRKSPYQVTAMGVARTFQNIRLFQGLTVLDNVRIAYHKNVNYSVLDAMGRLPAFNAE
jgi:branched-chain amino acid transport system ATP-binding protein